MLRDNEVQIAYVKVIKSIQNTYMVCRKILVLDGKMTFIMLDKFQINKLNYGYSAELKTSLWVTISCCLVLLCLFSLDNSMPSSFAGSGDVKNTSLNTVANIPSAMIEGGQYNFDT